MLTVMSDISRILKKTPVAYRQIVSDHILLISIRHYFYFHFSVQKYVYIKGQLIALFIIFFNISHIVIHI